MVPSPKSSSSKASTIRVPVVAQHPANPTSICENEGSIPGLAQWVKNLALLWLWWRPAAAAPIGPLTWSICRECGPKDTHTHTHTPPQASKSS